MDLKRLNEPFSAAQIHWRPGSTNKDKTSSMALGYIDARDVMDRLDAVCGIGGWQCEHPWSDGKKMNCRLGIKIDGEWVWKSDGAGDTSVEADKGAFSDALKRVAVSWGVGRDLYSLPNWWEPIDQYKKFTKEAEKNLKAKYENWLLPKKQAMFKEAYFKNRANFDSMVDAFSEQNLVAAAEYWAKIPSHDQYSLWLAPTNGGLLDQDTKKIIRSTEFSVNAMKGKEA